MKIFRLTSISQWAYLAAVIAFILMAVWVSVATRPPKVIPVTATGPTVTLIPTLPPAADPTPAPEIAGANTSVPTSAPVEITSVTDNRCIVTIDGQKYNVTFFRDRHSGGDVFSCGADMSAEFHSRHSDKFLVLMAPFRI